MSVPSSRQKAADLFLTRCDSEPIHMPGAVQPHGALLAFDPSDGRITHSSENLGDVVPLAVSSGLEFVEDVLGLEATGQVTAFDRDATQIGARPMSLALTSRTAVDVEVHHSDGLIVVEFEAPSGETDETREALLRELRLAVIRLESTTDTLQVCGVAAEELRRLTGYDRVMVYRFHEDEHGEVIAEARDPQVASYLGLHYPASDIPRPARRLLRLSPTRVIADVDANVVPIVQRSGHRTVLDLSRSTLRAVSPIHLQYLRNMGVAASLTISLSDGPRLWGLLACHHRTPRRPRPALRVACEVLARTTWLRIDDQEQRSLHAREHALEVRQRRLTSALSSVGPLAEALVEDRHAILDMLDADGIHVRLDGVSTNLGATPPNTMIEALLASVREVSPGMSFVTDSLAAIIPPGMIAGTSVAGAIAIPVEGDWNEHIVWFRNEQTRAVTWAGDPGKPTLGGAMLNERGESHQLSPRRSFEAWRETVRGRSVVWTRPEIDTALAFVETLPDIRRARARDALAMLAMRDALTGLPNRALLLDRLKVALLDLQRGQRSLAVLFLDLDGFKAVNDTLGHEAGDRLLVEVANRLRGTVRAIDTVARLGGDEFVIVCPSDADASAGEAVVTSLAGRLLEVLAAPVEIGERSCTVTASIGIAIASEQQSPAEALGAADAAMYRAKRLGPSRMSR